MKISLYPPLSIHEVGQRENQEDAIAQWDNRLFVLCDGMGGHERGEVASQTVCQSLVKWFQENISDDSFTDGQLRDAIEYAYTELDKFDDDSLRKMGTTLTLLYIHNQGVTAAYIGDSRIYHIRTNSSLVEEGQKGVILYQSRDHSLVFDLFQAGEITYEEMSTHPQKNIITRAMSPGLENRTRPDVIHITDIQPDDYFYMCSDGMLEQMSNDELETIFSSDAIDEEKRQQLIDDTANNQDNHTAWLIHVKDIIPEESDKELNNEEPTARCNAINHIPRKETHTEYLTAEEDDVIVISETSQPLDKKSVLLTPYLAKLIALLAFFIGALYLLSRFNGRNQEEQHSSYYYNMLKNALRGDTIEKSKGVKTTQIAQIPSV